MGGNDSSEIECGCSQDGASAFTVPPFSYYVPPTTSNNDNTREFLSVGAGNRDERGRSSKDDAGETYEPLKEMERPPSQRLGRLFERKRYTGFTNEPYRIPLWDQACLKYIFGEAFEGSIELSELFSLGKMFVMVSINCIVVAINVFYNPSSANNLLWIVTTAKVVFRAEFAVVYFFVFFLFCVIVEAIAHDNVGTNLAVDIAALTGRIATFSALRFVSFVSPMFAVETILPLFQTAFCIKDYLKILLYSFLWLATCIFAAAAVVMKITQIDFVSNKNISDWSATEYIQLIGLTMNLARVDDSYIMETRVLLDAVHQHFCPPGFPRDELGRRECLYTRVCDFCGIPRFTKYEYFDVIFDYHFDFDARRKKISLPLKIRKMLNYLAFVLRMDNAVLRHFLQMTRSPLPFYQMGRDAFMLSVQEHDTLGMGIALWRSNPLSGPAQLFGRRHKKEFNITYECEECREIWDAQNLGHVDINAASEKSFRNAVVAPYSNPCGE